MATSSASKVVICGAGFVGTHIAKIVATDARVLRSVQISSRSPQKVYSNLVTSGIPKNRLLPPVSVDVTNPATLDAAFKSAGVIISLVGIMHGTAKDFEEIQWKGAENVARAARNAGAKLIHFSAIGADSDSNIPYYKTKAMGEKSALNVCPDATVIRPSIVFGPEDDFFNRFSRLSRVLPILPVYGGGKSLFQPVYVGDLARAVEIISRNTDDIKNLVSGKVIEAGGPEVYTFRELMELVLKYNHRNRPIVSFPFILGTIQGAILEKFPVNLFTVTRAQVNQLKLDNIISGQPNPCHVSFQKLIERYTDGSLTSIRSVLPTYLS